MLLDFQRLSNRQKMGDLFKASFNDIMGYFNKNTIEIIQPNNLPHNVFYQ